MRTSPESRGTVTGLGQVIDRLGASLALAAGPSQFSV
jgi:hypothetical protein